MQKNVASQKWIVFAFDRTDNTAKTGDATNITANLRLDGGAANGVDDTNPTELEDGYYVFDITQAETNADLILISPQSSTSNIQVIGVPGVVYTTPPNFPAMGIASDGDLSKVNALDGHTAQTGDGFARLGAPAGASISADLLTIDDFVDELESRLTATRAGYLDNLSAGAVALASGIQLSAQGKLDVNAEADTALSDINLDHLCKVATVAADMTAEVVDNSILSRMLASGDTSVFDPVTDSLQDIRDKLTDIETDTAEIGTAGAGLSDLGGMATGMKAEIESECNDALIALKLDHLIAVADADDVVDNSVIAKLASKAATANWSDFVNTTDALEAIRDRGDAAWTTGAGGSDRLLMVDTTIATLASQTSFTLTAGSADDDAYNNATIVIEDASTATQKAIGLISNYVGSTKMVTLKYDPGIFTMAATDKVYILAENALKATLANRQLNVAADGDIAGNVDGAVGSIAADVGITQAAADKVRASVCVTGDPASSIGKVLYEIYINRLTAARAGYVDNINNANLATIPDISTLALTAGNVHAHIKVEDNIDFGATKKASINTEADTALSDYDPPTRAEATTDKNAIITEVDANETKIDTVDTVVDAIKAKTDLLPSGIPKNVALSNFEFLMVLSADHITPATGKTLTEEISKDGGAFVACTNNAAEVGSGVYKINLTQAEMNHNVIVLKFAEANCDQRTITILTSD